ncbi:VOC family protein [Achromobacter sp. SD115]|uniref:VOC family protein n=1 Tax=Achromobacter sp. SD115 TaxID=2782011 RepID=UPI001A959AF7|nr:VOC family protein [Achromobacter sp. SD115]MBO1014461.1 VOC family protein [Achromobacter sp. SD115]
MSTIHSIGSVQLSFLAQRREAVREFYSHIIGLDEVAGAGGQRLLFALGEATLSLSPVDEVSREVRPDYLALKTRAYDDILARLRLAGLHPVCSLPDAEPRVMYVKDPSGNQLAFLG